jgi:hypothetical protein
MGDVFNARESRSLPRALYNLSHGDRPWHLPSFVPAFFLATLAIVMEHGDSSRGSYVGTPGEGDEAPSRRRHLNPGIISTSRYGNAQNVVSWGVSTSLQEVREELATVKAVVTSLEEEAALAHSQRT